MANKIYPQFILARLNGTHTADLAGLDIRAVFVDTAAYTYSEAHDFLADIAGGARVAASGALTGLALSVVETDDVKLDGDDYTVTFAAAQPTCEALVYYVHTGSDATARLIKYVDTSASLPLTPPPGGGVVNVTVSADGILQIEC